MALDISTQQEESGRRINPHDPKLAEIVTRVDYEMPAAIAELVDNSIDAQATNVLIRLIRTEAGLRDLLVVDDGDGIADENFDEAMRFARQRKYGDADTGMYGIGMKSSSLAMAKRLTVISRIQDQNPSGRRWTRESSKKAELIDLGKDYCSSTFETLEQSIPWSNWNSGTVIGWGEVDDFVRAQGDSHTINRYAQQQMNLIEQHLGLTFHRLITRTANPVVLHLDIMDFETNQIYDHKIVPPINPFGYQRTGAKGYPKTMSIVLPDGSKLEGKAHIWPKGIKDSNFKIPRGSHASAAESQGLYIYRNNRLLMPGGWKGIKNPEDHQSLARMEIHLTSESEPAIEVTFNKTNVNLPTTVAEGIRSSKAEDGTTFDEWIAKAIIVARTQTAKPERVDLPQPQSGIPTKVRTAFADSATTGEEVSIEWRTMTANQVFRIVSGSEKLLINTMYKDAFNVGGGSGSKSTCLPLTLLLIATKDLIGRKRTQKAKALEAAIQQILLVAIKEQGL